MVEFGRTIARTDKLGNSMIYPWNEKDIVVLSLSSELRFCQGTLIEFDSSFGFMKGERRKGRRQAYFANRYSSTDFAFYDTLTRDLLVVRRISPILYYDFFYDRTRSLWSRSGTIEETEPTIKYYTKSSFDFENYDLKTLLGVPQVEVIKGVFPGKRVRSLLQVPHMPEPDRKELGRVLQEYLNRKLRQMTAA